MRIKSGDMISREFPICIYLICARVWDESIIVKPIFVHSNRGWATRMRAKTPNDLHLPPSIVEVTFEFVLVNFLCQFKKFSSS